MIYANQDLPDVLPERPCSEAVSQQLKGYRMSEQIVSEVDFESGIFTSQ
jgi:hypothetical protein